MPLSGQAYRKGAVMEHAFPGTQTEPVLIGSLQDYYSRILEYYDELFPLDEQAVACVIQLADILKQKASVSPPPIFRFLGVGCATGNLENRLANYNLDITGIDTNPDMIATAQRRIKAPFSTIRFFEMNSLDIARFLKEKSFNIISCIENMLPYIGDLTLVKKFLHDSKKLLAPGGFLLLHVFNFDTLSGKTEIDLAELSSIRVKLSRKLVPAEEDKMTLEAELELGNGQLVHFHKKTPILPLTVPRISEIAQEAGFGAPEVYGGYDYKPFEKDSTYAVMVLQNPD